MDQLKNIVKELQHDEMKILQMLSDLLVSNSMSENVVSRQIEELLAEIENRCMKTRILLEKFHPVEFPVWRPQVNEIVSDLAGNVEVTRDGWLHITLNTLLPNCRHRISGYIGDTIARLLEKYQSDIPYFEHAFLGIVEYCSYEHHNALDNDNKGWKMIPNALKGRVIEDDSQFCLSIGLFSKLSDENYCEIYVTPLEDASNLLLMLSESIL